MSPKENLLRVIRHDHPAWVPNGMEATVGLNAPVVERPLDAGHDSFGVHWSLKTDAEGGTYPSHGGHTISELHRWRSQITLPDVAALDWDEVAAQAAAVDRERYLVVGHLPFGMFERSYLLLGMEAALIGYITEPETMRELLEAVADYKIALLRQFHEVARLDMVWYGDDWGTQEQLFLPPAVWRAVVRPPTERFYRCAHELGIMVNQHSCGHIAAVFGDLVEMGAVIWNPCQPCNNLADLKRRYGGRIAFFGGIDSQFVLARPGATEADVRAEVRRRIDELAAGGGYIAAPSHSVPYDPALIAAMNDEIATYGRAVYASAGAR